MDMSTTVCECFCRSNYYCTRNASRWGVSRGHLRPKTSARFIFLNRFHPPHLPRWCGILIPLPFPPNHAILYYGPPTPLRSPGVSSRSLTFQRALQLQVVAFSPNTVQTIFQEKTQLLTVNSAPERPLSATWRPLPDAPAAANAEGVAPFIENHRKHCGHEVPRRRPCRRKKELRANERGNGRASPQRSLFPVPSLDIPRVKTHLECRRGEALHGKEFPKVLQATDFTGDDPHTDDMNWRATRAPHAGAAGDTGKKTPRVLPQPLQSTPRPAEAFDSRDMIMVARLLAHPESSLKVGGRISAGTGARGLFCFFFVSFSCILVHRPRQKGRRCVCYRGIVLTYKPFLHFERAPCCAGCNVPDCAFSHDVILNGRIHHDDAESVP